MLKTTFYHNNNFNITKKEVVKAFKTTSPIIVTYLMLGIGFGILMQKHGYNAIYSFISSVIIFSGTGQYLLVSFLKDTSFYVAAITLFIVSARYIFFSISMIGRYKNEGNRKWYLYFGLTDETYAVLSSMKTDDSINLSGYRFLVTLFDHIGWIFGSVLGGALGSLIKFDAKGLDFSMTALFITVYIEQWIQSKCHLPAILGLVSTLVCRIIFGRDIFLIPAMIIIISILILMRNKIEDEMEIKYD